MENNQSGWRKYALSFHGKGSDYFAIIIVNWFLTLITFSLYYPWAKAKQLQYTYGATAFENEHFTFHGTGKEMFKGYIKALLIFGLIFGLFFFFFYLKMPVIGLIVFYLSFFLITPLAIHGSYRYRMSRLSWRGIRFGYRGNRNELIGKFFKWIFFTLITLGIYGAWYVINLRNYVFSHIRLGDVKMKYKGDGFDFFALNLKGYILTILTLGIYSFWWQKELFEYQINNLSLHKGDDKIVMQSTATGGDFFKLLVVNLLIIVFTLGLGYAWVVTRTMDFTVSKIQIAGDINLDSIQQTEESYRDATGEDMSDFLDIDFIL